MNGAQLLHLYLQLLLPVLVLLAHMVHLHLLLLLAVLLLLLLLAVVVLLHMLRLLHVHQHALHGLQQGQAGSTVQTSSGRGGGDGRGAGYGGVLGQGSVAEVPCDGGAGLERLAQLLGVVGEKAELRGMGADGAPGRVAEGCGCGGVG